MTNPIYEEPLEEEYWINGEKIDPTQKGSKAAKRPPEDLYALVRNANRRTKRSGSMGKIKIDDIVWMLQRDGYQCLRCGLESYLTVNHVVPLGRTGMNTRTNIQTLCRDCSEWKGKQVIDFRRTTNLPGGEER